MGVKAVFGPLHSHMICFGGRGDPTRPSYYSVAKSVAERAIRRPFVLAIGGGARVRDNLGGHVLNLATVGTDFGDTAYFADPTDAARLAQWPVAVLLSDVWTVDGFPHLVGDIGMPDRTILAAAMDGVVRPEAKVRELWERLRERTLSPAPLPLPRNFAASSTPRFRCAARSEPALAASSEEGQRVWSLQCRIESSGAVKNSAKLMNRERNAGLQTCEACKMQSRDRGMMDAHHPTPLAGGMRTTLAEHLIVLCPTCHRYAHRAGSDRLHPVSLDSIRAWLANGRTLDQ